MKPNAIQHNPSPNYLRDLIEKSGLSQRQAARLVGINERTMRYYLTDERECPYPVQFCLESLAQELAGAASGSDMTPESA